MPQPFPTHPNYRAVVRGLLQMHRLTLEGRDESEEAEALRESMDEPWYSLSESERKRVTGLSEDLFWVSDNQVAQKPTDMNPQAQTKLIAAYEARQRGEWDRALELLRRWGKHVPPALVSYLRGAIWAAAGGPEVAVAFFEHSCHLEPENGNYKAVLLNSLKRADPERAIAEAEKILEASEANSPFAVGIAAEIVSNSTKELPPVEAQATYQRLIPIVNRTLARIRGDSEFDNQALLGMTLSLLALAHDRIGDTKSAVNYFSEAIRTDPTDDALLIARGLILYGNAGSAVSDFEEAVKLGSPVVWPYYFLAHHYLSNNRLEECRSMCERGLLKQAPDRAKSQLYDWLGISQAELNYPAPAVRASFESAIRLDPTNERARENLSTFESTLNARQPQKRQWGTRTEYMVRAFGREEGASYDLRPRHREEVFA
jgi:tetratricopeptide (TPR) repeat protein